jgi:ATP-dependent DNA ligase
MNSKLTTAADAFEFYLKRSRMALVFFLFDLLYVDGEDLRRRLVAEVKFLTWTDDNLLRQVVYEGLREDKPARDVRREVPWP